MRPPPDNETGGAAEPPANAAVTDSSPATAKKQARADRSPIPAQHQSGADGHPGEQFAFPGMEVIGRDNLEWSADAEAALEALARRGDPFTADCLRDLVDVPVTRNRVGMLFARASQRGVIEPIAATRSSARSRRHGMVTLWRGAA